MSARLWRKRHARHAGQFTQPMGEFAHQFDCALHRLLRLKRMYITKARKPRHLFVEARIVLHRAGAERIKPRINRVILRGKPHIVAHDFRLGQARQADAALPLQHTEMRREAFRFIQIHTARTRIVDLEEKRLFKLQRAIAGKGGVARTAMRCVADRGRTTLPVHTGHQSTSFSAASYAARSSSVLISVEATMRRFSTSGRSGQRRDAGTPPSTPFSTSASTTSAAGFGRRMVNSLKKVRFKTSTPGTFAKIGRAHV